ncbi:hypothetical protein [Aquimarina muelleri]|uniref:Uncharacterized protein n=1 Tax=Aquimarina muelleri TaxID=279356 RepID=A0A918JVV9_9FLAO|nr:hypothetical protein [Aquimarina muelleri]MCX2764606.1 hypothetical protein [Aquimarina muelleri]GGX19290.1 hypothetical protein GCM10007384_20800 [Aquimarina muelleri]
MGDVIKNIKEFIWDVIGYLIPGFLLIIVFNLCLLPSIGIEDNFLIEWEKFSDYLIVIISYILGYVVYSLSDFKALKQDRLLDFLVKKLPKFESYFSKHKNNHWEKTFKESATFKNAVLFLKEKGYKDTDKMKINEIRNILMSRNPSMDQKVYTFMFRASVFNNISTILLVIISLAFIQLFTSLKGLYFIKTTPQFIIIYFIFLFLIPLLEKGKKRFFQIAMRIPLSNTK